MKRLLLDTHTLIWWDDDCLPRRVTTAIQNADAVFVSAVTAWEIAIKTRAGKLTFEPQFLSDFDASIRSLAFEPLPIVSAHAVAAGALRGSHKDPFDRMLAAQAQVEGLTLVTADSRIAGLGVPVLW